MFCRQIHQECVNGVYPYFIYSVHIEMEAPTDGVETELV